MTFKPDPKDHKLLKNVTTAIDALVDKFTGIDAAGDAVAEALEYITHHLVKHKKKANSQSVESEDSSCG